MITEKHKLEKLKREQKAKSIKDEFQLAMSASK